MNQISTRQDAAAFRIRFPQHRPGIQANARAFVVWRAAEAAGWDISVPDLAEALGMSPAEVKNIAIKRGWINQLRAAPGREYREAHSLGDLMRSA